MDCLKFQDLLSDYLEGELDSRSRAECAGHRLVCTDCRELYTDVRGTIQALNASTFDEFLRPEGLETRILAATTTGEMLSCNEFDRLIEKYFDGVLLAPTFHTFQLHFEQCSKCRRLMSGIEEAIEICREIKEAELEEPSSLRDRILAATVGDRKTSWSQQIKESLIGFTINFYRAVSTPQIAAALLIFAASSFLVISRFGSVSGMASHATNQAELLVNQGQRAFNSFQFSAIGGVSHTRKTPVLNTPAQVKPSPETADSTKDIKKEKDKQSDLSDKKSSRHRLKK